MNRGVAEQLMRTLLALSEPLNSATVLSDQSTEEQERTQFRREIAQVMFKIHLDVMRPIIAQYPDLDPDRP